MLKIHRKLLPAVKVEDGLFRFIMDATGYAVEVEYPLRPYCDSWGTCTYISRGIEKLEYLGKVIIIAHTVDFLMRHYHQLELELELEEKCEHF